MKQLLIHLLLLFFPLSSYADLTYSNKHTLQGGWYLWDPYQYLEKGKGYTQLIGLDISLERAIAKYAGYEINLEQVSWKQHLDDLINGKRDIASGATQTAAREKFAYFSVPYREESNSLFTLRDNKKKLSFSNTKEFLNQVKIKQFKLGIVDGFMYVDPLINAFVADPENEFLLVHADNTYENLEQLFNQTIDGFLADRIAGATASWRSNNREKIEERVIGSVDIHLMFSKKNVTPATVEIFNQAIQKAKDSGEYDSIIREYLFPILLMQTIDRNWFITIDIIGTVAFALSGLIIAYREKSSLFKATILAALPAVGGGIIRDLIAGRTPIGVLKTPNYLMAIMFTVVMFYLMVQIGQRIYFLFQKKYSKNLTPSYASKPLNFFIDIFDALGLAAFTVIGVTIAFSTKSDPLWLWGPIFAVTTGVGGGIARDLLREDGIISALQGEFYAEVPFIWGIFLTSYLTSDKKYASPETIFYAVIITLIGCFLTRMWVIWFQIKPPYLRPAVSPP